MEGRMRKEQSAEQREAPGCQTIGLKALSEGGRIDAGVVFRIRLIATACPTPIESGTAPPGKAQG